jgi:hypothetical protein
MKFLATTAAAALIAAPAAFAQEMGDGMTIGSGDWDRADLIRTRDITGGNVYTTNEADDEGWDADFTYDGIGTDWNQIGEIEDVVLDRGGQVIGIVAEVGGFLDIGDKHVLIETTDLNLVAVDDLTYAYVTRLNEEDLEALPDIDEAFWE